MSSDKKQEQAIQKEFDGQVRDIRSRLSEQLTCLDKRSEVEKEVLQDFQEFFQSRAEIEKDYARRLERLYENHAKKRRLQTPSNATEPQIPSTIACWNVLMDMTRSHQKHHQILGTIYGDHLSSRFNHLKDALETVYRKSREMTVEVHMEILRVVNELFSALKSYHNAHTESKRAGHKFKQTEQQVQQKKGSTKEKSLEKQLEKSMGKFQECQLKATKCRNDYLMTLAATNTTLQKYFKQDVMSLIDCLDLGYVSQMKRTLSAFHSAELQVQKLHTDCLRRLEIHLKNLDAGKDKDLFLFANPVHFQPPVPFQYQPHGGDEVSTVVGHHDILYDELTSKYDNSLSRVETLRMETDEIKKSLDAVLSTMRDERINILQEDVTRLFHSLSPKNNLIIQNTDVTRSSSLRRKQTSMESEVYYLGKYKDYLQKANSQARIQSRLELIQDALSIDASQQRVVPQRHAGKSMKKMRKRPKSVFKTTLFGGDLEEYISITGTDIPCVVESCIEFISLYGIDAEGIFRMPGAQTEVNEMKSKFENGEDPLPDLGAKGDVHLVASVLKAYFRELPTPLFPADMTAEFMEAVRCSDTDEKIETLKKLVEQLPTPVMVVMRYLFEFLKVLSSHSDENMMDTHNLSVCFGPTLLHAPVDEDLVTSQSHLIDVVDHIILFVEEVFPKTPGRHFKDGNSISPTGSLDTIAESTCDGSEDNSSVSILAIARDDYLSQNSEELSFRKGQQMHLSAKVDNNYWRGSIGSQEGLVKCTHVNIPELSSPGPTSISSGFSQENINRLNTTLANALTPPDIVQDHLLPRPLSTNSSLPSSPSRPAPPVKPKPMRPVPSVRRHVPSGGNGKSQTM
ncbi:SLIT-ROBO Rho GTPase-activating protein 1-like isoform X2 [Apostichopus japonicus]|uniref:SLIT-ROBO Rho GTPase-activating protein 1-like isoform X2 n=1 Tax=Stichopus japonicus TaxID=307972 RepID=UPI003AB22E67